ncbi:mitochondrial 2-enoyl thioester reductase [Coemansia spiralis]|uniref:Mitochondrial 2-enoyl thioester reductase n=1 Tax=Coemansia spiralis TaxID=417178 RepID=A0A9W8GIU5_9FUNG|nr:mitochondrial 2-enoyl thioester reductase [Coemansia spiralis]
MLAAPVNPSDLNQIEGTYPVRGRFSDEVLGRDECSRERVAVGGNEGVGVVEAVGSGVSDLRVGDWVVPRRAGEYGTWCTRTVVGRSALVEVPAGWRLGVDSLTVGSMKVNPCSAFRLLRDYAQLAPGDWIIQNGANSGVGRAVIQMARLMGVHTINVVRDRSPEEYESLDHELSALGADLVVRDSDLGAEWFKKRAREAGPLKLGLNCVGGRMALAMTKHLGEGATLVSYGGMSRQPVVLPTSLLLFRDVRACGFWMNKWYENCTPGERDAMWRDVLAMARDGGFVAQPMDASTWDEGLGLEEMRRVVGTAVAWNSARKQAFVFA